MINLIPPDARKVIVTEYWLRVATVWLWLVAIGLCIVAVLNAPTYVLVNNQLNVFTEQYTAAQLQQDEFERLETEIKTTNALATHLRRPATTTAPSVYLDALDALAQNGVSITSFTFTITDAVVASVGLVGVAVDRAALTAFSDVVEAHALFSDAEIPIANLAQDKDITFTITVVTNPTET